jgi:hypothetical protein
MMLPCTQMRYNTGYSLPYHTLEKRKTQLSTCIQRSILGLKSLEERCEKVILLWKMVLYYT